MNIKSKFTRFLIGLILVCNGWFLNAGKYSFSGYLPSVEKKNHAVVIKINTLENQKDFYIHYKTKGPEVYQVRKMKIDKDGNLYYQLATDNLYGKTIEYFIARTDRIVPDSILPVFTITGFTNKGSPEVYFLGVEEGSAGGKGYKYKFPIRLGASLSASSLVYDDVQSAEEKFCANGNIRLYTPFTGEKTQFGVDANISYIHDIEETETQFNLMSMKVKIKTGDHFFTAGDVSIRGTEFTTPYLNRRGLRYKLEGKRLYLGSFFTNAQQKRGFEGFGIPPADANIIGAEAGFRIGSLVNVRGMFMTGKDNLESKTVVSSDKSVSYREGSVYSLWGEMRLFKNKLSLNGEFARSNFGSGTDSGSIKKENDNAWRAGINFRHRILRVHADYKKVGQNFDSIGNLFLLNDREGLNSNIGLNIKTFFFNLGYRDQKTNMNSIDPPMLHSKDIRTDFSWIILNHIKIGGQLSLNNLDYDESTGEQTGCEDMDTFRYSAILGYIAGRNGITIKLGKTEAKTFTSNVDGSVGVFLNFGRFLHLTPNFSYQSTKNFPDNSTSKIYNAYINGQINFIPGFFSLTVSGYWTKNVNPNGDRTSLSARGNLNFYMSRLFKGKIRPTLSLRAKYVEGGNSSSDGLTVYCQVDISF